MIPSKLFATACIGIHALLVSADMDSEASSQAKLTMRAAI